MVGNNAKIQQAVHGYHDGHRLLAASVSLPSKSEHIAVVLSDLSGHSVVRGFDEYITGYPLNEIGAYALAKTWYAPEMPRPGCVFTHTLFVPFALLATLPDLYVLTQLFTRPTIDDLSRFDHPIFDHQMKEGGHFHTFSDVSAVKHLRQILFKLYDSPQDPVLVPVLTPADTEGIFFSIWSQQWPRLRRSFSFCTGAISGRRLEGQWLDLQAIPLRRLDEIERTIQNAVVASLDANASDVQIVEWCRTAVSDCVTHGRELRRFLFEYGAEAEGGRRDFVPMTKLFLSLRSTSNNAVHEVLEHLSAVFPKPFKGTKFKEKLLTGQIHDSTLTPPDKRLRLVLEAGESLFDTGEMQLRALVKDAWSASPDCVFAALDDLLKSDRHVPEVVLSTVARSIIPDQLRRERFSETIMVLAARRPTIVASEAFRGVIGRDQLLIDYVTGPALRDGDDQLILRQWLLEGNFTSIEEAVSRHPESLLSLLLELIGGEELADQSRSLMEHLTILLTHDKDVAPKWLSETVSELPMSRQNLHIIATVACIIDTSAIKILRANEKGWVYLLDASKNFSSEIRKTLNLKVFERSLRVRTRHGARIATVAFPYIYRLPMAYQLTFDEWRSLQGAMDRGNWIFDWDKCRVLVEGLIDRFREYNWPELYFSDMLAGDPELASSLRMTQFHRTKYQKFVSRALG